ncbi:uncharacterized protein TrAFT101_008085 [Trichoderma asperellum]|uniref:Methyltransferase domain-containing protein n=2 Tax=Trichoderma asperellum TaxID=101201 RepID=A0A2T3Z2Z7_TRIA4|nr:hypothetical protein M441DRAFT_59218 [Trichoderma asperellum CBS 433.97]PTB39120.1 hypothetical protein M441DRAFT_59218 [Trichoderma asperellum CBS 433.97]UKZ93162.1 hypothetical protein TrAFT101_008085 [Trichoderma asperellum]
MAAGDFILGFLAGCAAIIVVLALVAFSFIRSGDIYGLGHWKLNAKAPFPSMWMNLGYWTRDDGTPIQHLDEAARNMLANILKAAGLASNNTTTQNAVAVLDVGFGCGDQTVALAELIQAPSRPHFRYVGLTLNEVQQQAAQQRLDASLLAMDKSAADNLSFKLFQADAAKPQSWNKAIRTAVDSLSDTAFSERWLLGLDCLYHFSPSRKPIFKHAAQHMDANVMAFDLVLSDDASAWQTLAVRLLGFVLLCPWRTFLTEGQYRQQLVECGYDDGGHIEIRDVSDHVFAGLAGFLQRQHAALSPYGISLTGYTAVGKVYSWLHRTRVLKAAIVVARKKSKSQ